MSRHEGVSCDSCLKGNFRGKRYKCLICYDYDLCSTCYEAGATTTRHTADHPVQCILTRTDVDLFYGGEALTAEQPQSFTCPYCCKMGFTETTLHDHATSEHTDVSTEVVCPICASHPGGDPNHVTDDFASHLTIEHRAPRDFLVTSSGRRVRHDTEVDEPSGMRHVRRIPHPGRGVSGSRTRRANMHFASAGNTLTGLSPSSRETMDPIAELLSQLSSVRSRAAAAQSVSSQLQQLEMQLQSTRQQLERLPRRPTDAVKSMVTSNASSNNLDTGSSNSTNVNNTAPTTQFLLSKCDESSSNESDQSNVESEHVDRSVFVQELLLSTLSEQLQQTNSDDISHLLESLKSPGPDEEKQETKPTVNKKNGGTTTSKPVNTKTEKSGSATALVKPSSASSVTSNQGSVKSRVSEASKDAPGRDSSYSRMLLNPSSVGGTVQVPGGVLNNNSLPVSSVGGVSLPAATGRSASGISRDREGRLNPAVAKRNMLKHMPTPTKTSDREPPPH
ncbi:E3 ubiquitin-protein ligase KCMF1 isoform X2 [Patella vulgata]|uniref:E3 ubiquitin-protein ligase KCMF1 isoform X2 n=1 Tax=Patella vulgata TaxID=6465 RepID=UPI00218095CA|nr:E3 ubiquitin-protein ligase KCMF1 isoform X2 [Patella vulgata]